MSEDKNCQRCGAGPDPDLRYLRLACFYDLSELGIPFEKQERTFVLGICKPCRADWMDSLKAWFSSPPTSNQPTGTGVFVRRNGAAVEATEYEVRELIRARPTTPPKETEPNE